MSNENLGDAITSIVEGVSDEAEAQDETLEVAVEATEEEVVAEQSTESEEVSEEEVKEDVKIISSYISPIEHTLLFVVDTENIRQVEGFTFNRLSLIGKTKIAPMLTLKEIFLKLLSRSTVVFSLDSCW